MAWALLLGGLLVPASQGYAQPADAPVLPQPLTLDAAIQYAAEHYPALRASLEEVRAAEAGVSVARTAYLPRLDALWEGVRSRLGLGEQPKAQIVETVESVTY